MIRYLTALLALTTMIGCADPEPTTFALRNDGDRDIYHDVDFWLSLTADGRDVWLTPPGCMGKCGLLQAHVMCELGARVPAAQLLRPGDETTLEWDGVYYEVHDDCYKERTANADFEATFCYGGELDELLDEPGEQSEGIIQGVMVKDPVCETQVFERGDDVELLAE